MEIRHPAVNFPKPGVRCERSLLSPTAVLFVVTASANMLSNALTTAALVLGSTSLLVNAQATSNATCIPQYSWMLNSLGQTPCLVSAYVSGVCDAGTWNVPALTSTLYPYNSPSGSGVNDCRCNTVEYQLISACTVCQGGTAPSTWASWVQNCPATEVNIKLFPHTVPQGTAIPAWAYIDSTTTNNGLFDPTAAKALINKPDVAAGTQPSITPGANVPTVTFVPGASVTQTATSGVKKSSSNTGAIVGGIIGGLALLLLIGLAIFLLMRRSNGGAKMQASPQYAAPPVPVATPGAYDHYNFAPPMAGPNAPQMGAAYPSTPSSQPYVQTFETFTLPLCCPSH
ncbi:hypothetical protein BOTBODRAFT_600683 [Botryobasidium botryosum FD-172 SS1]|uniref:Uncharacterized protein n=1 Tax=Botryobasidium botryosum (strain FD-172 SS1) TaxID=930990 RepID=A0A067MN77_BOTB1|nr:hypothetical protein BOTBODRAFT_600683 [Botryobasidium botryosum FD-172 SS1]